MFVRQLNEELNSDDEQKQLSALKFLIALYIIGSLFSQPSINSVRLIIDIYSPGSLAGDQY